MSQINANNRKLALYVIEYIDALKVKNYAAMTQVSYRKALGWFVQWCDDRDLLYPVDITRAVVEQYQHWMHHYRKQDGEPLVVENQLHRLVTIRSFFKWMVLKNYVLFNPAGEIELPKQRRMLPKDILSISEVEHVLNQPNVSVFKGVRDRAVLELFYSTGIRRDELRNIKIKDLDFEKGTLLIREGKGSRERVVPVGDRAFAWVNKYLQEVRPQLVVDEEEKGYLFLSMLGTGLPVSNPMLSQMVTEYVEKAQIDKVGSCHLFRHTMATMMLEHGADIRYIQAMLGHAKLDTTQIYTQVSIRRLKEIHNATHPAAFLKGMPSNLPLSNK